jgi:hypothetical protein
MTHSTHVASVTVAGTLTRAAARDLHGRIFRFISRSTALPDAMLEAEIDTLMLAIKEAIPWAEPTAKVAPEHNPLTEPAR